MAGLSDYLAQSVLNFCDQQLTDACARVALSGAVHCGADR
jgi:hypothetical protein